MNATTKDLKYGGWVISHCIPVLVFYLDSTEDRWILKNDSVLPKAELGI